MTEQGFVDDFLVDRDPRQWSTPKGAPADLAPGVFFLGAGNHALEAALATSRHRPKADDVRTLWRLRQGRRPSPLLLIVGYEGPEGLRLTVYGPVGENPPLVPDLEPSQVERLAGAALAEPSRHAAVRPLVSMLPEVGSDLSGLRNSGLLRSPLLTYRSGLQEFDPAAALPNTPARPSLESHNLHSIESGALRYRQRAAGWMGDRHARLRSRLRTAAGVAHIPSPWSSPSSTVEMPRVGSPRPIRAVAWSRGR